MDPLVHFTVAWEAPEFSLPQALTFWFLACIPTSMAPWFLCLAGLPNQMIHLLRISFTFIIPGSPGAAPAQLP